MRVIITGTTGMVGEGVLLECLHNLKVTDVLSISRKSCNIQHSKLKKLLVPDFTTLENYQDQISGYDACFFCAGVSSLGMSEEKFKSITYDVTMAFAKALVAVNSNMAFIYVSGASTDSTEQGKVMWARVKGKTENDLNDLGFSKEYNFRPGGMLPFPEQKYANNLFTIIAKLIHFFVPTAILTLSEVGKAMINVVQSDEAQNILEVKDIKRLSK